MTVDDTYTKALLHFDGVDNSTSFIDESGKAWSRSSTPVLDTSERRFGSSSGFFDGTNDYIKTADSPDWRLDGGLDTNAWTVDFWVRFASLPASTNQAFFSQITDKDNNYRFYLDDTLNTIAWRITSGAAVTSLITNNWSPSINIWYHIAIVKQGVTGYKMFVNGKQIGTTQVDTDVIPNLTGTFRIGHGILSSGINFYLNGWMDEFRVSKGIARWTSDFAPPRAPYPYPHNVANVKGTYLSDYGAI